MLDHAKRLSSSPGLFCKECCDLRKMFLKLKYPVKLIDSIFKTFHASQDQNQSCIKPVDSPVLITLPFKDQNNNLHLIMVTCRRRNVMILSRYFLF